VTDSDARRLPVQNVIPYCVLDLLFGLMWWLRDINIVDHDTVGLLVANMTAPGGLALSSNAYSVSAQNSMILGYAGIEGTCGWASLRDSHSGRLQASCG
jgi:hypothetical protein